MIETAPSVNFFISILDNGYSVLITINDNTVRDALWDYFGGYAPPLLLKIEACNH